MLSCSLVPDSLRPPGPQPARLLCPWDSPGRNPGVGCHALLQGIFPTQELKPHLLKWQEAIFFFPHLATCEEALTWCRIIHKFLLASKEGYFWSYSEVHHGHLIVSVKRSWTLRWECGIHQKGFPKLLMKGCSLCNIFTSHVRGSVERQTVRAVCIWLGEPQIRYRDKNTSC